MTEPISNRRRAAAGNSATESTVFTAALKRLPETRPEAVRRAGRLLKDPAYPTPAMLRSMSEFFVDRL